MRILHIGDIAFVSSTLGRELKRRGHDVVVLSKKKGVLNSSQNDFLRYHRNFLDELNCGGLRVSEYDIIHGHYLINWGSLGLRLKKKKGPVLMHCHGTDTRPKNAIEKKIQQFVVDKNKFLLYSTPDLLENIKWCKGRSIYLPNPVDVMVNNSKEDVYQDRVLIYGTCNRIKQTEKLFSNIEKSHLSFDMIDVGPNRNYFKKRSPKNISFINPVSHDNVSKLISKYPLILGASQDGSIRMCELEAMAMGIPALFPFRYDNFYDEALPMPENPMENFEAHLENKGLGERQRQWVELYHRTSVVVDQLLDIYKRVLNN